MAEAIISRRGTRGTTGIKPYVIQTSFYDDEDGIYFDKEYGAKVAYYDNGDVFLSVKTTSLTSSYSATGVSWELSSAPEGVSLSMITSGGSNSGAGSPNSIMGVVLTGISSNVSVKVSLYHAGGTYRVRDGKITITEV